jgi:hypothetical protein
LTTIPDEVIPFSYYTPRFCELYFLLDQDEKGKKICEMMSKRAEETLKYLIDNKLNNFNNSELSNRNLLVLNELMKIFRRAETRASSEVKRLEMMQQEGIIIPDETEDIAPKIEKMKKRHEYYQKEYSRLEKLFSDLYDRI